jgi:hypothetical protein
MRPLRLDGTKLVPDQELPRFNRAASGEAELTAPPRMKELASSLLSPSAGSVRENRWGIEDKEIFLRGRLGN